jgi:hypothetical protein
MNKIEYELSAMAVGMSISFLSMLVNSTESFHIYVDSPNHSLIILKTMFGIPDEKISISVKNSLDNNMFWELSDMGKLTSQYLDIDGFYLKGNYVKLSTNKNKPCIALTSYQDYKHLKDFDSQDPHWPNSRYRSMEEYSKLYALIKNAGYEVITLDNHSISLEDKLYWMNEYCDAVIGYEGGLCHLAHVLKIPSIIIPVKPYESFLTSHSLHVDSKTYFPFTFEEMLDWSPDDLKSIIIMLHNNMGNNALTNGKVVFANNFSEYEILIDNKSYSVLSGIRLHEMNFFQKYIKNHNICGKSIIFSDKLGIPDDCIPRI